MAEDRSCEYPGCEASEAKGDDIHTYGFTVDGLVEHEMDYCAEHSLGEDCINP